MAFLMQTRLVCTLAAATALLASLASAAAQQPSSTSATAPDYNKRWVDNTSGPFYTGTADVEPRGSFYFEPLYFNYRTSTGSNTTVPIKIAYGVGYKSEIDLYVPFDYVGKGGIDGSSFQYGDTIVQEKLELHKETDRYHLWSMPSIGVSFDLNIPTGHLQSAKPNVAGGSQTTNNTWNEQINILARKQFKPFQLYLEGTEIVQNPVNVVGPYQFNNGITNVPAGVPFHVVDGNVLAAAGTLEHVLLPKSGFGYLIELTGERQSGHSPFFGHATAPSFSYFNVSPEAEVTWPPKGKYPLTWGAGVTITAARTDYPKQLVPMFTVTLNGNLHGAR